MHANLTLFKNVASAIFSRRLAIQLAQTGVSQSIQGLGIVMLIMAGVSSQTITLTSGSLYIGVAAMIWLVRYAQLSQQQISILQIGLMLMLGGGLITAGVAGFNGIPLWLLTLAILGALFLARAAYALNGALLFVDLQTKHGSVGIGTFIVLTAIFSSAYLLFMSFIGTAQPAAFMLLIGISALLLAWVYNGGHLKTPNQPIKKFPLTRQQTALFVTNFLFNAGSLFFFIIVLPFYVVMITTKLGISGESLKLIALMMSSGAVLGTLSRMIKPNRAQLFRLTWIHAALSTLGTLAFALMAHYGAVLGVDNSVTFLAVIMGVLVLNKVFNSFWTIGFIGLLRKTHDKQFERNEVYQSSSLLMFVTINAGMGITILTVGLFQMNVADFIVPLTLISFLFKALAVLNLLAFYPDRKVAI